MNPFQASVLTACLLAVADAAAQPTPQVSESRGALLYSTHCIACHTAEIHWRDKKLATDWASLQAQVRRWQVNAGLAWSEADIVEVTRYLNALHYHFPATGNQVSLSRSPPSPGR